MAMFNRKLLVYQRVCRVCYIKPSNLGVLVVLSTYISSMSGAVFRTLLVVVEITTVGVVKHVHPPPPLGATLEHQPKIRQLVEAPERIC